MKALVYTAPETLEIRDMPDAVATEGEELVQIESSGICGSDMHAFLGHDERRPAPLILGHEVSGMAGGRRVTVNPLNSCGTCHACTTGRENLCPRRQIISLPPREGGFAEAVAIPHSHLIDVPDHITPDQAALCEPLACGWHAARMARAHAPEGRRAVAIGGGAIGLGAALCLIAQGQDRVTIIEPNANRRAYLTERTGIETVAPDALPDHDDIDIVIDGVGYAGTRAQASAICAPGGIILHIGLGSAEGGLDIRRMTLQEITFTGTYTYTPADFRDCAQAMWDGRLGALDWTETRPLAEGAGAFDDIRAGRVAAPKIILKP